ncbi:hypothetical protein [Burkholderia pseudomallei]|uniref:hypothetical protein n=1 Tax=Burkholderia pseudomallei TaxID=28450 RepID=UPI0018C780FD|nr:hypothetical protein [Burkholderia pseudomallei]MBG1252645.1 hypothetical protein [Burkholderia pseudomallei]
MIAVDQENFDVNSEALSAEGNGATGQEVERHHEKDFGPELLGDMEHFVTLARKAKVRTMIADLVGRVNEGVRLEIDWKEKSNPLYRRALFEAIAALPAEVRKKLALLSERIVQLTDASGNEAIKSLLNGFDDEEEKVGDRYGRALYLFLALQAGDKRFEQAEDIRRMNQQWKSERYASHYVGPKGIDPGSDDSVLRALKDQVTEIYPEVSAEDMVVEHFLRRDIAAGARAAIEEDEDAEDQRSNDGATVWLHNYVVAFNDREDSYETVERGAIHTYRYRPISRVMFTYEPTTGAISVFCDSRDARRDLARSGVAPVTQDTRTPLG